MDVWNREDFTQFGTDGLRSFIIKILSWRHFDLAEKLKNMLSYEAIKIIRNKPYFIVYQENS